MGDDGLRAAGNPKDAASARLFLLNPRKSTAACMRRDQLGACRGDMMAHWLDVEREGVMLPRTYGQNHVASESCL
jgi:hypothetical protein